jgi:hypothetical protein
MKRSFSDQIRRLSNRLFPNLKIVRCKDLPDAVAVAVAVAVAATTDNTFKILQRIRKIEREREGEWHKQGDRLSVV